MRYLLSTSAALRRLMMKGETLMRFRLLSLIIRDKLLPILTMMVFTTPSMSSENNDETPGYLGAFMDALQVHQHTADKLFATASAPPKGYVHIVMDGRLIVVKIPDLGH